MLLRRSSSWIVAHPVLRGLALGIALVLLAVLLDLPPVLVAAVGAGLGTLNIVHARRRGSCPFPAPGPPTTGAGSQGSP